MYFCLGVSVCVCVCVGGVDVYLGGQCVCVGLGLLVYLCLGDQCDYVCVCVGLGVLVCLFWRGWCVCVILGWFGVVGVFVFGVQCVCLDFGGRGCVCEGLVCVWVWGDVRVYLWLDLRVVALFLFGRVWGFFYFSLLEKILSLLPLCICTCFSAKCLLFGFSKNDLV